MQPSGGITGQVSGKRNSTNRQNVQDTALLWLTEVQGMWSVDIRMAPLPVPFISESSVFLSHIRKRNCFVWVWHLVVSHPNGMTLTEGVLEQGHEKHIKIKITWQFHNLYSSLNFIKKIKSRRMRWERHVARMGAMTNADEILVGKPEGKRALAELRRRWNVILE